MDEKFIMNIVMPDRIPDGLEMVVELLRPSMLYSDQVILNEEFPEKANEAIKQIYKVSGLESGEVDSIVINCYVDDIRSIRISINNNNIQIQNRMEYSGFCKFGWEDMQIYGEEFREIVLSDPFYTETLCSYFSEDEQMASWKFDFEGSGLGKKSEE